MTKFSGAILFLTLFFFATGCDQQDKADLASLKACADSIALGLRPIADARADRFQGKVEEAVAKCRGGQAAVDGMKLPWVDWSNYYGAGDASSKAKAVFISGGLLGPTGRGVAGSLIDLEYQRIELIKFNLFDNSGTFRDYLLGRGNGSNNVPGVALHDWPEFALPKDHPDFKSIEIDGGVQTCTGDLIRGRTLTGICNDVRNPLMGSSGQLFARNLPFEATFPELSSDELVRNRHGDRLGLLKPDPQVISRRLFTRQGHDAASCRDGHGATDPAASNCQYRAAPFFNVIAAFWIQFMTHDWFTHLEEGHNDKQYIAVGCTEADAARYGCRPGDRIDRGYVAQDAPPSTATGPDGKPFWNRAPKTMRNNNTAWWDASQIYGYDETSVKRAKRDPADSAKLLQAPLPHSPDSGGYLPLLGANDPMLPDWAGQEATAFPDNWTVGLSFLTNLFVREHNSFVDEFRRVAAKSPHADSGLRNPQSPDKVIAYSDVTNEELYTAARLVVAAEIAKIHTIEWTTQLLYDEPLFKAMNANWNGLIGASHPQLTKTLQDMVTNVFGKSHDARAVTEFYSAFASGAGIVGNGSRVNGWKMNDWRSTNGGVNHFGSPFNFPEEFITVYRLHPLIPDLIEYRDIKGDPNKIVERLPVVDTFRGKATDAMHQRGIANWGLSFGRQRLGLLELQNHPSFLQNLTMDRLDSATKQIDVAALDLIRDREHGVPRFNEFRRQYGLRTLTGFDDFVDKRPTVDAAERARQEGVVQAMREIYGQHICDASKAISNAQRNKPSDPPINDCLGHPNGTLVDNIEDVDTVVGFLAEPVRPHGYAISETQFVVFILNASRRLFSDRFLTSSFRPEFYTTLGYKWVNNNGPFDHPQLEPGEINGHAKQPVSPMKQVLWRNIPELRQELSHVINAFDPWARDRGEYYSLQWKEK